MALPEETLALLDRLTSSGIRLGTETTVRLLRELGNPQVPLAIVLVAGTNGKGSTAALLAAMATAAGARTGLFTSPYLEDFEEQIRVDGRAVEASVLGHRVAAVLAAARNLPVPPTVFETLTAAALLHFGSERCDLAILEAGMGGGSDATNATDPILSILTSVAFDHRAYLGSTLGEIATEKAGIFRPGRAALVGELDPESAAAVRAAADARGSELRFLAAETKDVTAEPRGWAGQRVAFSTPRRRYDLDLPLLGDHQVGNLRLAVLAAEALGESGWDGFDARSIAAGVAGCRWPGRLEYVPLTAANGALLDAAHNPNGVAALLRFLDRQGEPFDLLFGVLGDKDAGDMLPALAGRARRIVLTSPGGPRARAPHELVEFLSGPHPSRQPPLTVEPHLETALERALSEAPRLLVCCGSVLLVGEVRRLLRKRLPALPAAVEIVTGPGPAR